CVDLVGTAPCRVLRQVVRQQDVGDLDELLEVPHGLSVGRELKLVSRCHGSMVTERGVNDKIQCQHDPSGKLQNTKNPVRPAPVGCPCLWSRLRSPLLRRQMATFATSVRAVSRAGFASALPSRSSTTWSHDPLT